MSKKIKLVKKKPVISYSSSLIQQNFGEDYVNHGLLEWNVDKKSNTFHSIKSETQYYTIYINDNNFPDIDKQPFYDNIHLRLHLSNTDLDKAEEYISKIKEITNVKSISYVGDQYKTIISSKTSFDIVGNLSDVNHQNNLLKSYLDHSYPDITDEQLKDIFNLNQQFNKKLDLEYFVKFGEWKIKELWFDNMFSYGEANYINFESMTGIYGLYGENRIGKSAIIDVILFLLYDKSSRANKAIDTVNIDKDRFFAKLKIEKNGIDYYIQKGGKIEYVARKKHHKIRVSVDFWKEEQDIKTSLNGEQRSQTNKIIQQYFGDYTQMEMTNISIQNQHGGLIDAGNAERKTIFNKFLGIDIFESLYHYANEEYKTIKTTLNHYKNKKLHDLLYQEKTEKAKATKKKIEIDKQLEDLKLEKQNLHKDRKKLYKKLNAVNDSLVLDKLESGQLDIQQSLEQTEKQISKKQMLLDDLLKQAKKYSDELKTYDKNLIKNKLVTLDKLESKKTAINLKLSNLNIYISNENDKLKKLDNLEYDENCNYCMNNIFVKDAISTKKIHTDHLNEKQQLTQNFEKLKNDIEALEIYKQQDERMDKINSIKSDLKIKYIKLNNEIEILKNKKIGLNSELDRVAQQITQYHENKQLILENNKINNQIQTIDTSLEQLDAKLEQAVESQYKYKMNIQLHSDKILEINEEIEKYRQVQYKKKVIQLYMKSIHRDGIPKTLTNKIVPLFENKINEVLSKITDFKILVNLSDKNLDLSISYGDKSWSLKITSGMEKIISSIAIRIALLNITNISKSNFMIIDEGMGSLDSNNLSNMPALFDYLKTQFDFIIVISHLIYMRDITEKSIHAYKEIDNHSKIVYKG